jgi:hypothetical protein
MTLPVHPGTFHRHRGHLLALQPVGQCQEVEFVKSLGARYIGSYEHVPVLSVPSYQT